MISRHTPDSAFAARALLEADRYGPDPWVGVRELIQNARDAAAHRVAFRVLPAAQPGSGQLVCEDDGQGMSWEHARRYLFRLYASSKSGRGSIGRFGVGFWAVLRLRPQRIRVSSRTQRDPAWAVGLSGDLGAAWNEAPEAFAAPGTRVLLDLPIEPATIAAELQRAIPRYVRGIRSVRGRALPIFLDGHAVPTTAGLPPPALAFGGRGASGMAGLAAQPRVELFSDGLLVRSATLLEELLETPPEPPATRVGEGLAPCALLDVAGAEPMLSRADVRPGRQVRRAVGRARRATQRLIGAKLDQLRPRSSADRLRDAWDRVSAAAVVGAGALLAAALVAGMLWRRAPAVREASATPPAPGATGALVVTLPPGPQVADPVPYRDPGSSYSGPAVEERQHSLWPVLLRYRPASKSLTLTVLTRRPFEEGGARRQPILAPAAVAPCRRDCITFELDVDADAGPLPLPVPTGQRVDPASASLNGVPVALLEDGEGLAHAILPRPTRGRLLYRTGPAEEGPATPTGDARGALAPELDNLAASLRGAAADIAAARATSWLRRRLGRPLDDDAVADHRRAAASGIDFETAALRLGSGDCDVRNALLARVLARAGFDARLALGLLGADGRGLPWFHAWTEYRERAGGAWRVADASVEEPAATPREAAASPPPAPESAIDSPSRGSLTWAWALLLVGSLPVLLWLRRAPGARLDDGHGLATLLQGAIEHPEAWRDAPAVFDRRLLPAWGNAVSLRTAWTQASHRKLYQATDAGLLAGRARAQGLLVLDARSEESRTVARALSAIDLDAWDARLRKARRSPALDAARRALAAQGEPLRAYVGSRDRVLELPWASGRRAPERYVLVRRDAEWLAEAEQLETRRPALAALVAAEALLESLGVTTERRAELLAPLARDVLRTEARR